MDVFAHALWSAALYKATNIYRKTKFKLLWAAFWGIFPDLFAFGALFIWRIGQSIAGNPVTFGKSFEPPGLPAYFNPHMLYNLSHSVVIFLLVFLVAWFICKHYNRAKPWILGGWLLHILCDVPTHTYRFYPTPVLWPISGWKFSGISWGTPWFMITNYTMIVLVYVLLARQSKKVKDRSKNKKR